MANKTISKAILGLMTVMLLLVAIVVPTVTADIDPNNNNLVGNKIVILDNDETLVSFQIRTVANAGAGQDAYIFIDGELVNEVGIPILDDNDKQNLQVTLKDLKAAITAANSVALDIDNFNEYGIEIWDGDTGAAPDVQLNGVGETVFLTLVDDYEGYTEITENTYNPVKDYEIRNQDGDRKVHAGDTIVLTLELEGDTDYQDLIVSARAKDGDGAWVQTELVTASKINMLGEDDEEDVELRLEVPDYVSDASKDYEVYVWFDSDYINLFTVYDLTIELEEDSLDIRYAKVSDTTVDAGDSIVVSTRVYNNGEDEQEDVSITVEIDELDLRVTDTKSLGDLNPDEYEEWSIVMAIPSDADAGTYDLVITTASKNAEDSETIEIEVLGDAADTTNLDLDVVGETTKALNADGTTTFTFEIENKGTERQVVELRVEGADAKLSQSIITVKAGETETFTVTVKEAGDVTVFAEADGELVYEDITATSEGTAAKEEVIQVLQWIFAVIIIIAIILVIVWAVTKGRKNEDGKAEAYY